VQGTSRPDKCGFPGAVAAADSARLLRNWRAEKNSELLYQALARFARSPADADMYRGLADAEGRHANFWERRLRAAAQAAPPFRPSLRTVLASYSFVFFAIGATIPLRPFGLLSGRPGLATALVLSMAALFGLGVATSLFNARSPIFSGLRQTCIGAAAAAATYGAGLVFALLAPLGH
jgi:VIT1/CCC1 family predicted Fe2+/Mn2+ transporter